MPKITKRLVDAAEPRAAEYFLWCDELPGFGLRVYPSGRKGYLVQYRSAGRSRRANIGLHGRVTPDEARKEAMSLLGQVARGGDPAEERATRRKTMTIEQLCERYLEAADKGLILGKRGEAKKASTLVADRSRIGAHILPLLGNKKVAELTRADVTRFMRDVAAGKAARTAKTDKLRGKSIVEGGKGAATRTMGLLGGILSFALSEGVIEANPVHGVKRPADSRRKTRLTPETYAQLGQTLRKWETEGGSSAAILAIRLLALTGCRRGEVENLKWSEVDAAGNALRLEDSKEGASVRPIGRAVLALLETAAPIEEGQVYVVTGRDPMKPYGGLPGAWDRLAKDAGLVGITLHTLRHSFASTAADLGYSEPTIAAMIGHSSGTITGRYVHHLDAVLIAAADRVAAEIRRQMAGEAGASEPQA
ncbi:integrase arm-type DNA-binding domain-containing protein [Roseomonas marmotae]|uniref:tyrosine-type recombinase/integrase n=1 Tax=Roseomonas marmotae TaxID=2768161 RepID=UPI001AD7228A|nr:site-specific integrase [Roseomonas marmotae]QTI79028.1 integrase arm-type DNA-binding domain-containing protein [Roseomonas marmotae]